MSRSDIIWLALGWVFVFEGFFPLVAPEQWRRAVTEAAKCAPEKIRAVGSVVVALGIVVIWLTAG